MRYVLFGTGEYYKRFRRWFVDREVVAVVDNDVDKQGSMIDGYPVISPADLIDYEYDCIVILSFYVAEMRQQLIDMGISRDIIYHFYDIHELYDKDNSLERVTNKRKTILLLSHDLSLGGPALALFHIALTLKKAGYEVVYASMLDGDLRKKIEESRIPVMIDERLQVCTMQELEWTNRFDMVWCNTINYHVFLSERNTEIPVIWWLHDSPFFYEGIKPERLAGIDDTNLKILSVGPVPRKAMQKYRPNAKIDDLIYGVSDGI